MNLIPLISFVIITTFTPGPNNISSASFGMTLGYKKTLSYLLGIMIGFFFVMLVCALLSNTIVKLIPVIENYFKYIGAAYIVWLAWETLKTDYTICRNNEFSHNFTKGLILQLINPKALIFGLTMYSTFLIPIANRIDYLILSGAILATITFCATSSWALFGNAISKFLHNNTFKKIINIIFATLLLFTALELTKFQLHF